MPDSFIRATVALAVRPMKPRLQLQQLKLCWHHIPNPQFTFYLALRVVSPLHFTQGPSRLHRSVKARQPILQVIFRSPSSLSLPGTVRAIYLPAPHVSVRECLHTCIPKLYSPWDGGALCATMASACDGSPFTDKRGC